MKRLILALPLLLAACQEPELEWYEQPNDPEVRNYVFNQCMDRIKGPTVVHYNDEDEAIAQCSGEASNTSRYCEGPRCPESASSHTAVRAVLPKEKLNVH